MGRWQEPKGRLALTRIGRELQPWVRAVNPCPGMGVGRWTEAMAGDPRLDRARVAGPHPNLREGRDPFPTLARVASPHQDTEDLACHHRRPNGRGVVASALPLVFVPLKKNLFFNLI